MIWLSLFFLALAGVSKGFLDSIADSGVKNEEWRNKYDFTKKKNHWWYLGLYKPKYSEKFPFSTTVLVFLTDKWHRAQFFMLRFFYLSIAVFTSHTIMGILMMGFIVLPIILNFPFELTYSFLRRK